MATCSCPRSTAQLKISRFSSSRFSTSFASPVAENLIRLNQIYWLLIVKLLPCLESRLLGSDINQDADHAVLPGIQLRQPI
nr:MAG TPA_asm: hypothetical protein [Caudoviricetes sp.]